MKSSEYWKKRALAREDYTRKLADEALAKKVLPAYERAAKQLTAEVQRILHIFSANGEITPAEAQKLLNTREEKEVLDSLLKELDSIKDPETRRKVLNRLNAPAYGARISRLEALRAKIYTEMAKISEKEIEQAGRVIEEAYTHTYYRSIFDTQKGTNFAFSFELLPDKATEAAIFNSWSGHHYSKRVWQNTSLVAAEAEKVITSGIISGANINRMAKQLDDVMQSGKYAAVRLIRTEANHAYNSAELKAYEEEDVEQYQFLATLDNRTCEVCGKLDGKVFNVSEAKVGINYPPLHPNDRCTTVVHFDGDSLENLKRRARNPETGKNELVPANMTWEQWKKQFPEETFKRKTPPGKYLIPKQDKEQFERYSKTLKELSPKTVESFREIKYNKPEEWKRLKAQYRIVNRYEVPENVTAAQVLKLDEVAFTMKRTGFDETNFSGSDRRNVKGLKKGGNAASMELDGTVYFSHSRAGEPGTLMCNAYIGQYPLIALKDDRQFKVKNLGDGDFRQFDTEAKFLEFVADIKMPNDTFTVTMLSEKHICESCQGVVKQFEEMFPNATVNVISGKLGYNGDENGGRTWRHR